MFRKKSRGLCRTCYEKLNDQEYAEYKLWWNAHYEMCNRADDQEYAEYKLWPANYEMCNREGPTISLRENIEEMTGMTSAGSAGPSVKKQRTDYEEDQGKDRGKGKTRAEVRREEVNAPLWSEIRQLSTNQILEEMGVILAVLRERQ